MQSVVEGATTRTTTLKTLLIANRGEIALRIARTAAEMGIATVTVQSEDDSESLHVKRADAGQTLPGRGARAYLDADALLAAARDAGADAVHPGYGFLSESADFARKVEAAGLVFVGPTPRQLDLFGDKVAAKHLAERLGVPTLGGTSGAIDLDGAARFFDELPDGGAMLIKAVSGGGGRGMRVVRRRGEIAEALERCRAEAKAAFGDDAVYVERFLPAARHIEVQILGDGDTGCIHLAERECTLQRRHQKVVEIAPSPALDAAQRERLTQYALTLARSERYRSLGTFEFLMTTEGADAGEIFFIEANPRIQVEHTVTEEIFDLDLVRLQLEIARGASLYDLGLSQDALPAPRGHAIQMRVNMERMDGEARARPSSGTITAYEPPGGRGVRVDGFAYAGYRPSTSFDSLLAKVVVHSVQSEFADAVIKAARALEEFRIEGLETNISWLRALLERPEVRANDVTTRFIEMNAAALAEAATAMGPARFFTPEARLQQDVSNAADVPEGTVAVAAPMIATVVSVDVGEGDAVRAGQQVAVLEAMKMQHVVTSPITGRVRAVFAELGRTLSEGGAILAIEPSDDASDTSAAANEIDLESIRADLQEVIDRRAVGLDENRSEAVRKRRDRGHQTARENLAMVCDEGTFVEYGEFAVAAQSARRSYDDLVANTSNDGLITGLGTVNGDVFDDVNARCAFAICDYMVLAATQGQRHHRKLDRIFSLAGEWNLPVVHFAEGGGGRPGDTDRLTHTGVSNPTFAQFASLSGQVPLVGVVSGRCFAGNAALLGCCDVIIADESANIGMAGPAMIEGGGLGVYPPEAIGPIDVQDANGVVDVRVEDEAEGCRVAKQYLSYFQGTVAGWTAPDQRLLRHVVPENRLRVYEVRNAVHALADEGSVLELRPRFGIGMVTALLRIEGKPFGLIANNPKHLGGAIDSDAADKAARFMQLCDAFDIPMISLCDSPGFMVGPEAEKTALVRHVSRMYVTARSVTVPIFSVVLRKCYGLGAMAMLAGGAFDDFMTISWPTGEFGPMGLEGAVRLGFRRELEAKTDPAQKQALYEQLLGEYYENGKALKAASSAEIDAVIDPVDTRRWLLAGLRSVKLRPPLAGRKRPFVDAW
ncbi:carboxyl transferase domain-containing protein [Acuticoccus sp.]|uniref:acetyl-CoA carboxylase family protein n=1 Tax=Acuticoccus sp. TaxID=1904378 RepID=UPI003B5225B1